MVIWFEDFTFTMRRIFVSVCMQRVKSGNGKKMRDDGAVDVANSTDAGNETNERHRGKTGREKVRVAGEF